MKVLVTGANGYIGSVVMEKLEAAGVDVKGIDIEDWDIRESNWFSNRYNTVVHLAALVKVGESVRVPWDYYDTNVNGTMNVILANPFAKIIFASTGAAFNPTSPYGMSKVMAEEIIKEYCDEYTIFRFYNVGGRIPNNPEGLYQATQNAIENKEIKIFGNDYNTKDGTCIRDYVHVDDIADAIVKAVLEPAANTDYEPLGSGKSHTVKEYIDTFLEVNGNLFDVVYTDRRLGDLEKSEVPFMSKFMEPKHSLEDIVRL